MVQNVILIFFRRRLSQRPAVEELERRNILKREYQNAFFAELLEMFYCFVCRYGVSSARRRKYVYYSMHD